MNIRNKHEACKRTWEVVPQGSPTPMHSQATIGEYFKIYSASTSICGPTGS